MTFSENLARTRKALGMSQEDLAGRVGVSRQAVSKWETGDAAPDLVKLLALADALDISLDALCGRTAAPAPVPPPAPKQRRLWPGLWAVLALCLILTCGAAWRLWSQRNVVPAEAAQAASTLPDTFTVSAENFSYSGGYLKYTFVPNIVGEGYTYQITFAGTDLAPQTFDVECVGGVCSGSAYLSEYDVYTVSVVVSDGTGSRAAAIARDLSFREGGASWVPLEKTS